MRKFGTVAAIGVAVVALTAPAAASAEKLKLKGQVVGQPQSERPDHGRPERAQEPESRSRS